MNKIVSLILALSATAVSQDSRSQIVLDAQRQWIESYNHHDHKKLSEIEADDFRIVFGDGRVQTKAEQVANLNKPVPPGAQYEIKIESTEARRYGNAAVLTGIVVESGKYPDDKGGMQSFRQRSRYTDTWIFQHGRWEFVSSHLSEIK